MNLEIADTDKISIYKEEAQALGFTLLPPDINKSSTYFTIEVGANNHQAIRYGIGAIKGISKNSMDLIIAERDNHGDFQDIFDLCGRVESRLLNKRQLEAWMKSGAVDNLCKNRRQLIESIDILLQYSANRSKDKASSQRSFFDNTTAGQDDSRPQLPEVAEWDSDERLKLECEVLGFYLSAHPLDKWKPYLKEHDIMSSFYLANDLQDGYSLVKISGIVSTTKTRVSPRGRYVSVQLSDSNGIFEVSIFNDEILARSREMISSKAPLLVTAEARKDEGGVRMNVQSVQKLDSFLANKYSLLKIWMNGQEALTALKSLCGASNKQGMKVQLIVVTDNHEEIQLELPDKYSISPANSLYMESQPGIMKVKLG